MQTEKIAALQAFLAKPELEKALPRIPLGHAAADLCLRGGVEQGYLHEVFSAMGHEAAATGFAAGFAARVSANKHLLWITQDFSAREFGALSPTGLLELGHDPSKILLLCVSNADDALRAANDALTCAAFGAVVVEITGQPKALNMTASRRLTLVCAQSRVSLVLLRFGAEPSFNTAETRWRVSAASSTGEVWGRPVFQAELLRNRRGQTGEWVMEWSGHERIFKDPD